MFDCEMAIYFQPNKEDEVVKLMEKAVELRNVLRMAHWEPPRLKAEPIRRIRKSKAHKKKRRS